LKKSLMTANTILYFLLVVVEVFDFGSIFGQRLILAEQSYMDIVEYFMRYNSGKIMWPIAALILYLVSLWFKRDAEIMTEKAFWIMGVCTFPLHAYMCVIGIIQYHTADRVSYSDTVRYLYIIVTLVLITPIFINLVICAITTGRERRALNKRLDTAAS